MHFQLFLFPELLQSFDAKETPILSKIYHLCLSRKTIEIVVGSAQNSCPPTFTVLQRRSTSHFPDPDNIVTDRERERERERRLRGNTCREERSTFPIVFVPCDVRVCRRAGQMLSSTNTSSSSRMCVCMYPHTHTHTHTYRQIACTHTNTHTHLV